MKFIPKKLYTEILKVIPIACVDAVVVHDGAFLLGKRANRPNKGKWMMPGGRILKGESLEKALKRKLNEELGIRNFSIERQVWAGYTIHKTSAQGPGSHTVNIVYLAKVPNKKISYGDGQNTNFEWFTRVNKNWIPYVKESLYKAGFK